MTVTTVIAEQVKPTRTIVESLPACVIVCSGVEASLAAWLTLVSICLARDH